MMDSGESLLDIGFEGQVIEWRGPPPFYFLPVPAEHAGEVAFAARQASYGWGVVPVDVMLASVAPGLRFSTSLFPRGGGYLLPLKVAVRRACGIGPGDIVAVRMRIAAPGGDPG